MKMRAKGFYMVSIILTFIMISDSCTKDRGRYELFPLKVGNEYYYQYLYSFDDFVVGNSTIGNEKWTVLTDSVKNKNVEYFVEKKLNAIHIDWSILPTNSLRLGEVFDFVIIKM